MDGMESKRNITLEEMELAVKAFDRLSKAIDGLATATAEALISFDKFRGIVAFIANANRDELEERNGDTKTTKDQLN